MEAFDLWIQFKAFEFFSGLGITLFVAFIVSIVVLFRKAWKRTSERLGSHDIYGGE